MGYWVGEEYWNNGYCTEAARKTISYCFKNLEMNKVYARHQHMNFASGRVLEKCGMKQEGCQRQQYIKNGKYLDIIEYGILKGEYKDA